MAPACEFCVDFLYLGLAHLLFSLNKIYFICNITLTTEHLGHPTSNITYEICYLFGVHSIEPFYDREPL